MVFIFDAVDIFPPESYAIALHIYVITCIRAQQSPEGPGCLAGLYPNPKSSSTASILGTALPFFFKKVLFPPAFSC